MLVPNPHNQFCVLFLNFFSTKCWESCMGQKDQQNNFWLNVWTSWRLSWSSGSLTATTIVQISRKLPHCAKKYLQITSSKNTRCFFFSFLKTQANQTRFSVFSAVIYNEDFENEHTRGFLSKNGKYCLLQFCKWSTSTMAVASGLHNLILSCDHFWKDHNKSNATFL